MRLGVRSLNPLIWLAEATGVLPTPLMVSFWGMESSRALIAACELGVFDALADRPRSAADVATQLDLDEHGTETLLNALAGFGYVRRRNGRYSLRRSTRRWFGGDARVDLTTAFGLLRVVWDELGDLEHRIRAGDKRDFHRPERDTEFWRRYETGLAQAARLTAGSIVRAVRFDAPPSRLLDVGGGHAAYSAAFCRRYPNLRATVLDLEPAIAIGRELVAEQGLSDRIDFRAGDLATSEWGEGYDAVLLFNVVHLLDPDAAATALRRAYQALVPGGTLAVLDSVHAEKRGGVDMVGGGAELLFYALNSTQAYPEAQLLAWVRDAGFERLRARHLPALPEVLITAQRR